MKTIVGLIAILLLSISCEKKAESVVSPNVIWLMAEDISLDLECYGMKGVQTPNLNRLAEEGAIFSQCYGTNSICSPNRSAMMVGVHQNLINAQHHRSNRNIPLPEPYKPITYWLREAGYTCILGHHSVFDKGRKIDCNFKHQAVGPYDGRENFGLFDKLDTISDQDQPFFAQIQLKVTHRGDWWKEISSLSKDAVHPDSVELPPYMADHPLIREDWARYLDQIEYMDAEVGMLMQELEEKGLAENTVVIFIGDNGRCNIRGKGYLHDPGLHIPLIIRWPAGLKPGQVRQDLVSVTDISATILELAGISLPDYMESRSILSPDFQRDQVIAARDLWDEIMEKSRAIATPEYKYIQNGKPEVPFDAHQAYLEFYRPAVHVMRSLHQNNQLSGPQQFFFAPHKPAEELYDLNNDPHELNNLALNQDYLSIKNQLREKLIAWEKHLPDTDKDDFNFEHPESVDVLEWVKSEHPDLYQEMLNGTEIGFQGLAKQFRDINQHQ
ncbi:MAG: sulfatase family protein [Candidatus Cyclobacteriaceae bacterium M3_2C_046]